MAVFTYMKLSSDMTLSLDRAMSRDLTLSQVIPLSRHDTSVPCMVTLLLSRELVCLTMLVEWHMSPEMKNDNGFVIN